MAGNFRTKNAAIFLLFLVVLISAKFVLELGNAKSMAMVSAGKSKDDRTTVWSAETIVTKEKETKEQLVTNVTTEQRPGQLMTNMTNVSTLPTQVETVSPANIALNLSDEWLMECAKRLAKNETGIILPFPTPIIPGYRLGDCIKMCGAGCNTAPNTTLAYEYKIRGCGKHVKGALEGALEQKLFGHISVVQEILQRRNGWPGYEIPLPDELVIHLRLGDVIEWSKATVSTMLVQGADPAHHANFNTAIKSVYEYLQDIQTSNASSVKFVGGSHFPYHYKKSRVYANCLQEAIQTFGQLDSVTLQVDNGNADQDFYYMSHAKLFVQSSGGYSRLVGNLVESYNGTVIGRTF